MAKKKIEEIGEPAEQGMVLYSDGGSRNYSAGWGVHGYLYSKEKPKKGSGNTAQLLTEDGYVEKNKNKDAEQVKPLVYVDGFGSVNEPASNNVAELIAATYGFSIADKYPIKKFTLMTDSQYVVKGATEWLPKWHSRAWVKDDGTPVSNKTEWLSLEDNMKALNAKGVDIKVNWIKGHANHLGNELADKNATVGVMYSVNETMRTETDFRPAEGYWSKKNNDDHHPFFSQKRVYFNTKASTITPGEYYLGDHGKEDELLGKRMTDGKYSYIELTEPDKVVEAVRDKQVIEANGSEIITAIHLDTVFNSDVSDGIFKHGGYLLAKSSNPEKIDLQYACGGSAEVITRGFMPPRLSYRASESCSELKGVLTAWKNKDPNIVSTNITSSLFDVDSKDECKFKDSIPLGTDTLKLTLSYGIPSKEYSLDIYLGVDIPDRNTLKKLEKLNPEVYLVSWMESNQAFRYASIIRVHNGLGIWAGVYSNLKIIAKDT